jgi:hypothetical protein
VRGILSPRACQTARTACSIVAASWPGMYGRSASTPSASISIGRRKRRGPGGRTLPFCDARNSRLRCRAWPRHTITTHPQYGIIVLSISQDAFAVAVSLRSGPLARVNLPGWSPSHLSGFHVLLIKACGSPEVAQSCPLMREAHLDTYRPISVGLFDPRRTLQLRSFRVRLNEGTGV